MMEEGKEVVLDIGEVDGHMAQKVGARDEETSQVRRDGFSSGISGKWGESSVGADGEGHGCLRRPFRWVSEHHTATSIFFL